MESIANISSEEELLGLRREGKISETEYRELLGAMKKGPSSGTDAAMPETDEAASKRRLGKIALYLMIGGIVAPIAFFLICFAITGGGEGDMIFRVCFMLCGLVEITAFVFGLFAWPDALGKATVATISAIAAFVLLFMT